MFLAERDAHVVFLAKSRGKRPGEGSGIKTWEEKRTVYIRSAGDEYLIHDKLAEGWKLLEVNNFRGLGPEMERFAVRLSHMIVKVKDEPARPEKKSAGKSSEVNQGPA